MKPLDKAPDLPSVAFSNERAENLRQSLLDNDIHHSDSEPSDALVTYQPAIGEPIELRPDFDKRDNPETTLRQVRGFVTVEAQELGFDDPAQAIHSPDFVRSIINKYVDQPDKINFPLRALAILQMQPEILDQYRTQATEIVQEIVDYLKDTMTTSELTAQIGDSLKPALERPHIYHDAQLTLSIISAMEIALRATPNTIGTPNVPSPSALPALQYHNPNNAQIMDGKAAMQLLNSIGQANYDQTDFLTWQASLDTNDLDGTKQGEGDKIITTPEHSRTYEDQLHIERAKVIQRIGDLFTDTKSPHSAAIAELVRDVRVVKTDFDPERSQPFSYIALSALVELRPGKFVEATVLERPCKTIVFDADTRQPIEEKQENATYVFVSREPHAWMELFDRHRPIGGVMGIEANPNRPHYSVPDGRGNPEVIPARRPIRAYHREMGSNANLTSDQAVNLHVDKIIRKIDEQIAEINRHDRP